MKRSEINDFIRGHQQLSVIELAAKVGLSTNAVRKREYHMGLPRRDFSVEPTKIKETVRQDRRLLRSSERKRDAEQKYKSLLVDYNRVRREMSAVLELQKATTTHIIRPTESVKSEAVAIAVLSDTHVEESVEPQWVNGLNKYNLDIAKKRHDQFFEKVVKLLRKEQKDVTINELVLGLLGDHITGRIHEENLEICLLRPVDAIIFSQDLIESGIKFLLDHSTVKITVICKTGNHARITRRIHSSTQQGNSLEWSMYHNLRSRFKEEERIKFVIDDGYHTYTDILGTTLRWHHGHAIRYQGGVGGLTIPLHKAIHNWNLTRHADVDILGHFHDYITMRRFVVNGSLIGYNAYALSIKAEYSPPTQSFFLIDKKRGKTVHIPILFDI